jgi:hypothetical protein
MPTLTCSSHGRLGNFVIMVVNCLAMAVEEGFDRVVINSRNFLTGQTIEVAPRPGVSHLPTRPARDGVTRKLQPTLGSSGEP